MSKIILGTVQFGLDYGINNMLGKTPVEEIHQILDYAYSKGISTLDTASGYGDSEKIIGNYLTENPDKKFAIITKVNSSGSLLEKQLKESLSRLKLKKVDVLMLHSFELYQKLKPQLNIFCKKNKGKHFNELGVSVYTNDEIEVINSDPNINRIQTPFNLLDNEAKRREKYTKIKSNGKVIDTRSVFLQGLFFKDTNKLPVNLEQLRGPLEKLKRIADSESLSMEELAIGYVSSMNFIDNILIGVDSLDQLKKNINVLSNSISKELVDEINSISIQNTNLLNPSLWKI
ncbi:aldo/keto reductase [Flavobacteriaceae bacterium]|nr:aldo/keto reductase [Flavobacteriaceae bacterium]